jgi:DNA repair photolyase
MKRLDNMTRILRRQRVIDEYNFPYTLPSPYTGCPFGCLYCYSIRSRLWSARLRNWGIRPNTARPKANAVNNLRRDLQDLRGIPNSQKEVQIGNFFEPYPPIEMKLELTRRCLEVFTEYPDWKVHIETKSPLITRDIDILNQLNNPEVEITITTLTHERHFEPNAPPTSDRFNTIRELANSNVYVRVMIMPVLGDYTDINAIIQRAIEHGASDFKIKDLNYFDIERISP